MEWGIDENEGVVGQCSAYTLKGIIITSFLITNIFLHLRYMCMCVCLCVCICMHTYICKCVRLEHAIIHGSLKVKAFS